MLARATLWISLAACLAAATAYASVQVRRSINELDAAGWFICEREGRLYLVDPQWRDTKEAQILKHWSIGAPTIMALDPLQLDTKEFQKVRPSSDYGHDAHFGRYLTVDFRAEKPQLTLSADKKSELQKTWGFDFRTHEEARVKKGGVSIDFKNFRDGIRSSTFRLTIKDAEDRSWFVSAVRLSDEEKERNRRGPVLRPLELTTLAKDAIEFRFVEAEYRVQ